MNLEETSNQLIKDYMGKLVHVVIDRPIGYQHGDITYPINYGYIPGVIAGDGEDRIADAVGDYDLETVKSSDKDEIEQLVKDIDALLDTDNLTDEVIALRAY